MALQRTHILLESEQQRLIEEVSCREGRRVSDIDRQILQEGIQRLQEMYKEEQKRRHEALSNAEKVRKAILGERHNKPCEDIRALALVKRGDFYTA